MTTNGFSTWGDASGMWSSSDRSLDMARALLTAADAPVGLTPKELVWRKNKARLYRYTRSEPATHKTPIFLVLPLINRAYILDLRPGASFVEFLLREGFDVFLIDWGTPGDEDRALDITTLVTRYLPRAAKAIQRTTGMDQITVLGYCIGGTLATCFAALNPEVTKNLVLFTAPLDFSDAGQFGRMTKRDVFPIDALVDTFPTVPGQVPEIGSKLLNPLASYVGTYKQLWEKLADPTFDVPAWQSMYRWVNEGVPFAGAAFRQWIVEFYQENRLALDMLVMDGRRVLLSDIHCPVLNVAASRDQIAPRATTCIATVRVRSLDASEILVDGGHVGIVVGRNAKQNLWPKVGVWLAEHD
jgi:polyhydroxyalkanoate synthase subunit PhaC